MFDLTPSSGSVAMFVVGWAAGWVMLWRTRPLVSIPTARSPVVARPSVAVVIPARNEAAVIGGLVEGVAKQLRQGRDELVVVDDHSTDATAQVARRCGARVIGAPDLPVGWAGKPHACFVGAMATSADMLVFLDADVAPGPDLIDRLVSAVDGNVLTSVAQTVTVQSVDAVEVPGALTLVSMQPWHTPGRRPYEQLSWPFNIIELMGSLKFTAFGNRVVERSLIAFGPVIACRRVDYERTGGHGHLRVRAAAVSEDIALGRLFDRVELFTGAPDTTFRMYPDGPRSLLQGWTKNIATGAAGVRIPFVALIAAWVWSLAGGWLTSPWFYAASVVQLLVQSRKVGRFSSLSAVLYPLGIAVFIVIFVRSAVMAVLRRPVTWKGRKVDGRS